MGRDTRKSKALSQYSGPLTTIQGAKGIQAAVRNARALLADAELLLANGRWQRAAAVSILAIEESGKPTIIREILTAQTEEDLKATWRAYRSHIKKNAAYILPMLVAQGARKIDDFYPIFSSGSDHPDILDAVKQIAFYSDACGKCNWSVPEEVVDEKLAKMLFGIASILVPKGPSALSSKEELDIYVRHIREADRTDANSMKKALLACYEEAQQKRVLQGTSDVNEMMTFLFGDNPISVS